MLVSTGWQLGRMKNWSQEKRGQRGTRFAGHLAVEQKEQHK